MARVGSQTQFYFDTTQLPSGMTFDHWEFNEDPPAYYLIDESDPQAYSTTANPMRVMFAQEREYRLDAWVKLANGNVQRHEFKQLHVGPSAPLPPLAKPVVQLINPGSLTNHYGVPVAYLSSQGRSDFSFTVSNIESGGEYEWQTTHSPVWISGHWNQNLSFEGIRPNNQTPLESADYEELVSARCRNIHSGRTSEWSEWVNIYVRGWKVGHQYYKATLLIPDRQD